MASYDNFENEERSEIYKLFAGLFLKEPDDEMLLQFKEMFKMKFNETPQEIRTDFRQLFSVHGAKVKPYESFYNYSIGERPSLWGRTSGDVMSFYRAEGLDIGVEPAPVPDHLSVELVFMSYLVEKGLVEQQKKFLEEHLAKWVPNCCYDITLHAKTAFFKEISDLLKELLRSDLEGIASGS